MEKILLRVGEAAELLNVSRWTVYRWIEEGRLEATKIGRGSLRVFRGSVLHLVESRRIERWTPRPGGRSGPTGPDSRMIRVDFL